MKTYPKQRGQALIIVALAAVGLFAFTSLAVDGGIVFSKKRQAQNAADAAALAGGLALIRSDSTTAINAAYASTVKNAFNNDAISNEVHVYNPPVDGPYTGQNDYIQVKILVHVTTYLTRVIGRDHVDTAVEAIAHATLPTLTTWHQGDALVSTMPGCRQHGDSDDPFVVIGNANITVNNSGIRVNSDCTRNGQEAFSQNGHSDIHTQTGVCVTGAADYRSGAVVPPPHYCTPSDASRYQLPNPTCTHAGQIVDQGSGNYVAIPGNFNGTFPGVSPAGTLKLLKGIYCLHNGFDLHSTWTVTTDLNGNGAHDSLSEGAFFYVDGGGITFNGNSYINIHAIDTTADDFPQEFVNFLFYVPPSNEADIKLTGSNGSQFTGTILAPNSHTEILGNNATLALNSQVISYTVKVSGGGNLNITYNEDQNGHAWTNPGVEMVK
jgi:Flp pilus assembly protein TadG